MSRNSDTITDVSGKKAKPEKPKWKEGGCLKGIITCGVSLIMILVVLVGGGLLIGNGYLKQNYGFGIGDAFAVIKGLKTDGKKIIEQTPSENEQAVTDMCDSLGGALMLKDGTFTPDDLEAIISSASGGGSESGEPAESDADVVTSTIYRADGESGTNASSIGDMLLGKLKYENVDQNKLVGIDGKFTDEYFTETFSVKITPAAISALAYGAVESLITKSFSGEGGANAIIGGAVAEQVFVKVPDGATDPRVTITVSVPIRANVESTLGEAGLPSFLVGIIKSFLPQKMYLTCYVDVIITDAEEGRTYDFSTDVVLNSMNADQRESTYKVIGGILKMTGNETADPKAYLNDLVKDLVSDSIKQADEMLDIKATLTTGYDLEVFKIIADQVFADKGYEAEDIAALYTGLLDGTIEKMRENNASGVFKDDAGNASESETAFVDEFSKKYLVAKEFWKDSDGKVRIAPAEGFTDENKITLSFTNVLELMGVETVAADSAVNGIDVRALIDTSKLDKNIDGTGTRFLDADNSVLRLTLTEKMLGVVLENRVKSGIGGDLSDYDLALEFVRLPKKNTLELGFSAKKDVVTRNAAQLADLLPEERIGIVIVIPLGADVSADNSDIRIYYSSIDPESSPNRADRISKILADNLSVSELGNIRTKINDALAEIEEKLGMTLSLNSENKPDNATASLGSLFDVLAKELFDGKPDTLTADELKNTMKDLYDPLVVDGNGHVTNGSTADDGSDAFANVYGFDSVYANLKGEADLSGHDNETDKADRFNSYLETVKSATSTGLSKLATTVGYYHAYAADTTGKCACTDRYMYLTFVYDIHDSLGSGSSDQSFGAEKIYATFIVDKETVSSKPSGSGTTLSYYATKLVINNTADYTALQTLIDATSEESVSLDELAFDVGLMMYNYHASASAAMMKYVETGSAA